VTGAHEEGSASTLDRLHNSGAVPREVFHTAPIGRLVTFDFQSTLLQWAETREDLEEVRRWGVRGGVVPMSFLAQAARVDIGEIGA
jgi:hypothetical protein